MKSLIAILLAGLVAAGALPASAAPAASPAMAARVKVEFLHAWTN